MFLLQKNQKEILISCNADPECLCCIGLRFDAGHGLLEYREGKGLMFISKFYLSDGIYKMSP